MSLPSLIRTKRKAAGFSQVSLAERMGVSKGAVAQWELDEGGTTPSVENMALLKDLLQIDAATEPTASFPHGYKLVENPEQLAWLTLFDLMDESERLIIARMIRGAVTFKRAA